MLEGRGWRTDIHLTILKNVFSKKLTGEKVFLALNNLIVHNVRIYCNKKHRPQFCVEEYRNRTDEE